MIRTGLRLSEQAALLTVEIPPIMQSSGYHRFFLPREIAKGGSERWVYVPSSILSALHEYLEIDRGEIVQRARNAGRYRIEKDTLLLDAATGRVHAPDSDRGMSISVLSADERRRVLVDGPDGREPGALWLAESGQPMAVSSWKDIFSRANERCLERGVRLSAHAHLLRHSFAVITLEQLQRGHIASLRHLSPEQRGQYVRVFGDPLDWVRRRLGHRSVETTQRYLHALAELEMETRMALIPDDWEDPRDLSLLARGR